MIINCCYSNDIDDLQLKMIQISLNRPDDGRIVNLYNKNNRKEAKKVYSLMNKYAFNSLPFVDITDDEGNPYCAFYSERDDISFKIINDKVKEIYENL